MELESLKKEAEEYRRDFEKTFMKVDLLDIEDAYQKGAEFGYNKANEWHYVKDGDLPKDEGTYLVYISGNLLVDRWHNGKWMLHFNTDAWKEIVLPELKE